MTDMDNTRTTGPVDLVSGVVAEAGFVGGGVVDLVAVKGGPFLTVDVVDPAGGVIGCVAVVDGGAEREGLVERLGVVAAKDLGGAVQAGGPVGSAMDLAARFQVPISVRSWMDSDGVTGVVFITGTDRRSTGPGTGVGSDGSGVRRPVSGLDKLANVALDVSVELGRTRVTLADVLDYDVGSVVELDRAAGAPVDIRVNDTLLAQGEVVLIDDEYAVRITAIIEPH